jgi:hypothetical protein
VWGVSIDHAVGRYSGNIGDVDLTSDLDAIRTRLGAPDFEQAVAPVLTEYVWERGDIVYVVEAYSEKYGSNLEGEVRAVSAYSRKRAPRTYVGYQRPEPV